MKHTTFLAAIATAATVATGATASSVDISIIEANWFDAVGGNLGNTIDNSNPNNVIVRWPSDENKTVNQSSYTYERAGITDSSDPTETITPFTVMEDSPFSLGTFTHNNFGIPGGAGITSARLDFTFGGFPTGFPAFEVTFGAVFDFLHDETPNSGPCAFGEPPCPDKVKVSAVGGADETVRVGNQLYTFTLLGFSTDGGFTFDNEFITAENAINPADLYAKFTVAPIPLPAAGWLLLGGLGALGVAARRRRKDA